MERDAVRDEAELGRAREDVDGLARHAAEFPAERPFGADAVGQDAAEDARAGRGASNLLHLLDAVDREERHAELRARGQCRAPS